MRFHIRLLTVATVLSAFIPAARADTYDFKFSGPHVDSFEFSLPSSPTPTTYGSGSFDLSDVQININGNSANYLVHFSNEYAELVIDGLGFSSYFFGPVWYTGTSQNPTFILGSSDLFEDRRHLSGTLTITDQSASPVPEPSTIVLMAGAIAAVGVGRRKLFC
jgi:hypothetical protein